MATRPARIEITADSRSLTAGLRAASRQVAGFAATSSRVVGRYGAASAVVLGQAAVGGLRGAGRGVMAVARASRKAAGQAVMGAAAIGTAALVSAAADVRAFEEGLTRLGTSAGKTPAEMAAYRSEIRAASRDTGIASNAILDGARTYVELTGDMDGARRQSRLFAQVTQASGASMEDVAGTAAALQDSLKIDPSQMEAAFSALMTQGKAGAVELKDMAGEMASLAPTMTGFAGGTGLQGLRELGAALQVTRKGFESASEAATGMVSLTTALKKHADKFKGAGVKLFNVDKNGVKTFRNFRDIVREIGASSLAKDPAKLAKAFGNVEALRAFNELNRNAALYDELIAKGQDAGAVQRDLNTYLSSDAGKITKSWNGMKEAIASAFTPERIQAFAAAMSAVADKINAIGSGLDAVGGWLGRGVAGLIYGDTPELAKFKEERAAREERARELQWRRGLSKDEAMAQVLNEDNALSALRKGRLDWRSAADLQGQRNRIAHGEYTNKDKLLLTLDQKIANAQQREASPSWQALTHGKGQGMFFGPLAEGRRQQLMSQADANMLAAAIRQALVGGTATPLMQIGSDQLARTVAAAPVHRRRPGGSGG